MALSASEISSNTVIDVKCAYQIIEAVQGKNLRYTTVPSFKVLMSSVILGVAYTWSVVVHLQITCISHVLHGFCAICSVKRNSLSSVNLEQNMRYTLTIIDNSCQNTAHRNAAIHVAHLNSSADHILL